MRDESAPGHPGQQHGDVSAVLRTVAELLQADHGSVNLSGFVQRAMDALHVDCLVVAERVEGTTALALRIGVDRQSSLDASDLLRLPFVRRALDGEVVIGPDGGVTARGDAAVQASGWARYAALPLRDAHRDVTGVLVCAARQSLDMPEACLRPWLEIIAARVASILALRAERTHGRNRALLDGLTGLPNRILFNDRLEWAVHDARRTGEAFAVLFVDLDRFKTINDSLGHAVGDRVLVAEARRLRDSVRASDTVARYAGDEFTLILRHVRGRDDVTRVVEKLWLGMQAPLVLDGGAELRVTGSIGVSIYPDDAADAEGLVKRADTAMYNSKGHGRNTVQTFGEASEATHRQRLEMESRLRKAEQRAELCVHYQPQIDVVSEDITGVEALVRWQHPELGLLSPGFFIPLAEETGLILSIGEWVLRRACADVVDWQQRTGLTLRLALNLSALQWMQPNLAAALDAVCRDSGLAPGQLDLETTESVIANPQPELLATVSRLRRLGCRIMLNDAGAGHVTLDTDASLPIDGLTIDRDFIANIGRDPHDEVIVTAMLDIARDRQYRVTAEGVETERQLDFLRERGCTTAQGILFCRPLAASACFDLLVARSTFSAAGETPPTDAKTGSQAPKRVLPVRPDGRDRADSR